MEITLFMYRIYVRERTFLSVSLTASTSTCTNYVLNTKPCSRIHSLCVLVTSANLMSSRYNSSSLSTVFSHVCIYAFIALRSITSPKTKLKMFQPRTSSLCSPIMVSRYDLQYLKFWINWHINFYFI